MAQARVSFTGRIGAPVPPEIPDNELAIVVPATLKPEAVEALEKIEADIENGADVDETAYLEAVTKATIAERLAKLVGIRDKRTAKKAEHDRQRKALVKAREDATVRLSEARAALDAAIERRRQLDEELAVRVENYNAAIHKTNDELEAAGVPNGAWAGEGERFKPLTNAPTVVTVDGVTYQADPVDAVGYWLWVDWSVKHGWRRGLTAEQRDAFTHLRTRPDVLGGGR